MPTRDAGVPDQGPSQPPVSETKLGRFLAQTQQDFECHFYGRVLKRCPDYIEVLQVVGHLYTEMGLYTRGLKVDRRLARLRPDDSTVHYNLACSYALLHLTDQALASLRRAFQLGYRDLAHLKRDHDLDTIRDDPRYRDLLAELGAD